ncbi:unnamed protein product [Paramecium pentaurelia]|uniref:EGF-like domain-containing protein n=1 Tax=Paramecium pentaurelia TaxID=43138 RepID=A0A8S1SVX1_9CILI|nr:unnamed protein product [Paramecium pentaurelia]
MFHLLVLLIIVTNSFPITELVEGTSTSNLKWEKQDSSPFNQQFSCDNGQLIGPFLGKVEMNIKKTITDLEPHYSLQITIDLLLTEYWSGISNYVNILLDSQTIYSDSSISSSNFNTPSNYCQTNAFFTFVYNQQLITIRQKIINQNISPTLEIQSSFQCTQLSTYTTCEKLLVKNIVITPFLCHFTCLTCNGPDKHHCLTCPQGIIQNGRCNCENGYYSFNYQCIQSCPQYYINQGQECRLNCSLNCQDCQGKQCRNCENGYILYNGSCVNSCPKGSSLQNDICVDYSDQSKFGSEFIGKYFDGLQIDLESQISEFTFTFNPLLSKLTGQIFSTFNNQYLLGGFGVWGDGYFNINYYGLPAHNKIRIYLTAWFIDNWTDEHIIVKLDNQIIYDIPYQSQKAINNLFYQSNNDYIEDIFLNVVHTSSSAQITFQTTLSISAYQASLALSNIYILIDYCDDNCDICINTQCTACKAPYQLIHNVCALCDSTNFRNSDCTCQIGYYDDNINQQCQKCRQECESCLDANICTYCKLGTNLITLPYCMNCNTGFYYDNGMCSKCDPSCLSCFGNGKSQCLSCYNDYVLNNNNECQTCMTNQFIYNNTCQDCQYNCETCNAPQNCLTCTIGRINAPFCICQTGYFESDTKQCQPCNFNCSSCEIQKDNCLICSGNRLNPPLCKCPSDSDQNDSYIWCTDCSIVNLDIKITNNIKKLIIKFGKQIKTINSYCPGLFEESTLHYLGINPICFVNSYSIEILLGQNATIYFGLSIHFKPNIIKLQQCQQSVSQFLNNILNYSTDLEAPLIIFSKNSVELSTCSNNYNPDTIYQIQTYNFGSNQITFIEWKLIRASQQDPKIIQLLDNLTNQFKNYNQTNKFEFLYHKLDMNNEILLELKYQNFLGIQGSSFITIKQLKNKLQLNVQTQKNKYLNSQLIQIFIQVSQCQEVLKNDDKFNISIIIGTLNKQVEVRQGEYYIYYIEPYMLNPGLQQLNIKVFYQENLQIEDNYQILIVNEGPLLQLMTETNYLSFSQKLVIHGEVKNLEQQNPLLKWDCFDITQNAECQTLNQTLLILSDSQNLTLQPYTLNPFTVYKFTASFLDLQQSVSITIVETNVPKIEYESYPKISDGFINYYDQLLFKFKYLEIVQNPDLLLYTGILSNSDLLIKHFRFNYLELQISLWHYFTIDELTNHMTLKINIHNPDYFLPSQVTIPLNINIPPLKCRINLDSQNASTISNFTIKVTNCQDDNIPLQYRLVLYYNDSDLNLDYSINTIQKGIILFDYQYSNIFETKLTGNEIIQLMVQVKDNLNGISNYTTSLNFTYVQGHLAKLNLNSGSITETLIYAASLQFEQISISQEISQILQKQIEYFSSCQCVTQKQLVTLKTLSKNHMSWKHYDIQNELSLQKERLSSIKQLLANQHLIEYYKYEHTLQELKKITLLEETVEIAKYINELYELNRVYQYQTRILIKDQDIQIKRTNNYIIMDSINLIADILLQNQIINGKLLNITTNSFKISTQKTTQKVLEYLISNSLTEPQVIGQEEQLDNKKPELETYSYKMVRYSTNPYNYDSYFTNNYAVQQDYPLYQPEIKYLSNQNLFQNIITAQGIRYNFENQDQNLIVECVAKVKESWSLDSCQTIQENKKIICQCQYISSTTILEAAQKIFDEAVDFFSLQTIHRMLKCQYQSIIFTYIVMIYTILFLWFILYGYKLDQTKNEDNLFHSTKVTPTDWDFATEKHGRIINIGETESEKQLATMDGNVIRRENPKKTIFNSNDSQITSDDKYLKRPSVDYYKKMLATKKSLAIATNICSERIMEENEPQLSPKSRTQNSPSVKIVTSPLSTPRMQYLNCQECLYEQYITQRITFGKAILFYIEINHKVLSLYYLYDKDCSRIYRTIILYVALLGEISILTFFGKIINFNSIIALSLLQTLFGVIYRKLLQVFLRSEKKFINYIGFNLVILSILFFLFMIFGSVAKYQSVLEASLWGVAYISSFILDYIVYTNFQILLCFSIIVKFGNSQTVKKYLKVFLNDKVFIQIFGNA